MIKFFRQSYAIQYVVIALLAIALWIPAFAFGKMTMGLESPVTPIFNVIDDLLDFSPIAQHALAFLLLAFEALIFNVIMVKSQIVGKVSTMGAFVFVLLMSLTGTQTNFYPFVLSVPFILLAIDRLFEIYLMPNPELNLLKVGIYVALASMCYFPSIVLILWVMIVLPIAKKGSLRLQLIPLLGFLAVYFLFFVGVFLFSNLQTVWSGYRDYFLTFGSWFQLANHCFTGFVDCSDPLLDLWQQQFEFGKNGGCANQDFHGDHHVFLRLVPAVFRWQCIDERLDFHCVVRPCGLWLFLFGQHGLGQFVFDPVHDVGVCQSILL